MSKAASLGALEGLHALVAETLKAQLANAEEVTPQMLAQAIKFLKDNNIEPAKDVDNSALDALSEQVKKFQSGEADPRDLIN